MPEQTQESLQSFFEATGSKPEQAASMAQQSANVGGGFGSNQGGSGNITLDQSPQAQELLSQGKELYGTSMQDVQDQIEAGEYKKGKKKPLKFLTDTFNTLTDFAADYAGVGGLGGVLMTPFKMLAEPTEETFKDPKTLAQLALLFDKNKDNPKFAEEYINDHGELIKKVFEDEMSEVDGMDTDLKDEDLMSQLQNKMDAALKQAKTGFLGKSSQYSTDPVAYYEKYPNLDQTTTQLNDLAKLDAKQFPALADKIFAARAELDRMGKNPFGTGGSSIPGGPGISSAYNQGGGDSGSGSGDGSTTTTQDFTMPDLGPANIVYPDAQETVDTYASNSPLQNLLTGALNAKDGGIINAADGTFIQISMEQKQKLPLTFNEIREAKKDMNVQNKNMGGIMGEEPVNGLKSMERLAPNFNMGI